MAQLVETKLLDDLDGSEAEVTKRFRLDGKDYEIDLSRQNAERLASLLSEFVRAARRSGQRRSVQPWRKRTFEDKQQERNQNQQIREWAQGNGFSVSDRGRIPAQVMTAYYERDTKPDPGTAQAAARANEEIADEILSEDDKRKQAARAGQLNNNRPVVPPPPVQFKRQFKLLAPAQSAQSDDDKILEWAKSKGMRVTKRGVTGPMRERYLKEHTS